MEYARLYLALGGKEQSQADEKVAWEGREKAREMIERMGYHRRDKDVREIDEQLKAAGVWAGGVRIGVYFPLRVPFWARELAGLPSSTKTSKSPGWHCSARQILSRVLSSIRFDDSARSIRASVLY